MRKLNLKKETIAELSADELTDVVAAAGTIVCVPTNGGPCGASKVNCSYDDGCVTARGCLTDYC